MEQYTIYCTEEQTKKAYELGAPIVILPNYEEYKGFPFVHHPNGNEYPCAIPTAEQMIGFLRENSLFIEIMMNDTNAHRHFDGFIFINTTDEALCCPEPKETFEEATLAAIDVALDYLSKK